MGKITATTARREHEIYADAVTREFDAADGKGRRFGARALPFSVAYGAAEQAEIWDYPSCVAMHADLAAKAGTTRYGFHPHALRGGELYGASHRSQEFETEAERDAALAEYFAQAEKRAMKNKARAS